MLETGRDGQRLVETDRVSNSIEKISFVRERIIIIIIIKLSNQGRVCQRRVETGRDWQSK